MTRVLQVTPEMRDDGFRQTRGRFLFAHGSYISFPRTITYLI